MLLTGVLREVCLWFDWRFVVVRGAETTPAPDADVALLIHARRELVDAQPRPFHGVHIRRDPREVVVSGYLYYRHAVEHWCQSRDAGDYTATSAAIPNSQLHRSDAWKRHYVRSLKGRSYQGVLNELPQRQGLQFEMTHYASCTIEDMLR